MDDQHGNYLAEFQMSSDFVEAFQEHYGIRMPHWWHDGRVFLSKLLAARDAVKTLMGSVSEELLAAEPTFGLLNHLTDRVYEHLVASIACYCAGIGPGTESTARTALESATNIRFILLDRNTRMLAWLRHYVEQDKKEIERWEKSTQAAPAHERSLHTPRIATRKSLNISRQQLVERLAAEFATVCPVNLTDNWPPQASARFEAIGESTAYRTAYARMSSHTHTDAEDTISYMLAMVIGDQALSQQMALETVAYSGFLLLYGARAYLAALGELCTCFSFPIPAVLSDALIFSTAKMVELGDEWEW